MVKLYTTVARRPMYVFTIAIVFPLKCGHPKLLSLLLLAHLHQFLCEYLGEDALLL